MGKHSTYSPKMGMAICQAIAEGASIRKITKIDGMPAMSTIFKWLLDHPEFSEQYAHAKEMQAEVLADEIIELADDSSGDVSGELQMPNSVAVQRSRLRVDSRKWVASKLLPKKYGDKIQQEVTGANSGPIQAAITVQFVKTGTDGNS